MSNKTRINTFKEARITALHAPVAQNLKGIKYILADLIAKHDKGDAKDKAVSAVMLMTLYNYIRSEDFDAILHSTLKATTEAMQTMFPDGPP